MPGSRPDRSRSDEDGPQGASEHDVQSAASAPGAERLRAQLPYLEEEISTLRRRLTDSPRHVRILEDRLAAAQAQLAGLTGQNEKLVGTLREARDQILSLKDEGDRLPPAPGGD